MMVLEVPCEPRTSVQALMYDSLVYHSTSDRGGTCTQHCLAPLTVAALCPRCCCSFYGESIPGNVLCERIASYKHLFNLYWYTR